MSDLVPDNNRATPAAVTLDAADPGTEQVVTQADIDDILSNTAMTLEEKQARLHAYAGDLPSGGSDDRGSQFEPLQTQILDALSFLADGGHAYGSGGSTSPDTPVEDDLIEPEGGAIPR